MNNHKEIYEALIKIPPLCKEYHSYEKSLSGTSEEKKKLSKDGYVTRILQFEEKERQSTNIRRRLIIAGTTLNNTTSNFKLSFRNKEMLEKYISAVGRVGVSERIKAQMELMQLLEVQEQFQAIDDLLDETKIKALETYLKGRK